MRDLQRLLNPVEQRDEWTATLGPRRPNAALMPAAPARRKKLWDLMPALHCSVVGTCLMSGELRVLLRRCGAATEKSATDHDLHELAVSAAGRQDSVAKELQKALDQRHKTALARFANATDGAALRALWDEAVQSGDISGAYWAVLTHPLCDHELVHQAFGDVHMLSHLVGSANRVAMQRLRRLEHERAELTEKLHRQQERMRDLVVARDARISALNSALLAKAERKAAGAAGDDAPLLALNQLVIDLRKQLDVETRRRERAEKKSQEVSGALLAREQERAALAEENAILRAESAAAEEALAALSGPSVSSDRLELHGRILLYVGGRPRQVAQMKLLVQAAGGELLHHDGGIEEHAEVLPGLVSRAEVALFPVDCISHAAALSLKRLCRQAGKPFVPLRSSGTTSLLYALKTSSAGRNPS
jgi:hypothetical protein